MDPRFVPLFSLSVCWSDSFWRSSLRVWSVGDDGRRILVTLRAEIRIYERRRASGGARRPFVEWPARSRASATDTDQSPSTLRPRIVPVPSVSASLALEHHALRLLILD